VRRILQALGLQYTEARRRAALEESRTAPDAAGGIGRNISREWWTLFSPEECAYIRRALEVFDMPYCGVYHDDLLKGSER